jgi:hypothetical protein
MRELVEASNVEQRLLEAWLAGGRDAWFRRQLVELDASVMKASHISKVDGK